MIRNKRKYYEPCEEPESTIIATLAHHHGATRFDINSLVIPGMTSESIRASLAVLEARGYLRTKGDKARLSSVGVEVGLAIFSIIMPPAQPDAGTEPTYALFQVNRLTGETVRFHPDRFRVGTRLEMENFAGKMNKVRIETGYDVDHEIQALGVAE